VIKTFEFIEKKKKKKKKKRKEETVSIQRIKIAPNEMGKRKLP
jgi:hypothetical protein